MKKILSLVLALALTLSLVSTASAVEIINNNQTNPATEGTWELCSWLTDNSGYVCAQKHGEADTVLAINANTNQIAGIIGNGKIQRAHNRHMVTLDEYGYVDMGDGEPIWCKLEFVELKDADEQAEFDAFGIVTVEDLEDALTQATYVTTTPEGDDIYAAYYRGVEIDLSTKKTNVDVVAKVYIGQKYFHVLLVDYDGDGERELCLHFGLLSSGKSSGGNKPSGDKPGEDKPNGDEGNKPGTDDGNKPGTDDGNKPGTDDGNKPGTDDEGTKPAPGTKPNPENDTVILPWGNGSSTGSNTGSSNTGSSNTGSTSNTNPSTPNTSNGNNTPNPGNDDVKLPF